MSENLKVSCNLTGGLGNQLFQIAATLATAKKYGRDAVFFPPKFHETDTKRPSYLNSPILNGKLMIGKDEDKRGIWESYNEDPYHRYRPIDLSKSRNNVMLNGYFQSSKYFEEYSNLIRDLFKVNINLNIKKEEKEEKYTVSIHVRRTDYCKLGWDLKISYYKKCINYFLQEKNIEFLIFSDDIEWCKQEFKTKNFNSVISFVDSGADWEQLFIMSQCDAHIMSNSTFCWWAAYLGDPNKIKKVLVPEPWFRNTSYNPRIYEEYWIRIPVQ